MVHPDIRFMKAPGGENVAYAVHGDGPLVLCPAWWVSHVEADWDSPGFARFFERLGAGLRLVRYDRPGVGLSDRNVASRTLDDEVDLLGALLDHLGADSANLFAMSCGAPVAVTYAAKGAAKAVANGPSGNRAGNRAGTQPPIKRICFYGAYACGTDIGPAEVQSAVLGTVRAHWGLGSRALADIFLPGQPREVTDWFAATQRKVAAAEVAANLLQLTYDMDASGMLPAVECETLVLHRRGDRAIPLEAGRKLAAGLPNARFVPLDGRAHPPWVDGDAIADAANRFLRQGVVETEAAPASAGTADIFDRANRQLRMAGEAVPLTRLEYGVLAALVDAEGAVVTRDELLESVWQEQFAGSNRVDAVVRNLRRKLGASAAAVETAVGHGYRFAGWR